MLLVEADLRRPVLADWLGLDPSAGPGRLPGRPSRAAGSGPGGRPDPARGPERRRGRGGGDARSSPRSSPASRRRGPAELLQSKRFSDLAATASQAYDLVIFDAPPLLPVTDALDLIEHADSIVLCARANQTTRDQLRAALDALKRLPERPTGIVVTGITHGTEGDYGYYGYPQAYSGSR